MARIGATIAMGKTDSCIHETIRRYLAKGLQWDGERCCAGHLFHDGSIKPGCWVCMECGEYVGYDERQSWKEEKL